MGTVVTKHDNVINGRDKGKRFELKIAAMWSDKMGGTVERSGYVNKKLDDAGVDLVGTDPFNIQCKAVESSINVHKILDRMPQDTNMNVVIHKRNHAGTVVSMSVDDFMEIVMMLRHSGAL
jgi:hypothetical protein